jgi:hypothetical protein
MADKRISELEAITGANTAADDFFLVVDTSGAVTKKISRAELNNAIEQDVLSVVDINGGTIDGAVIGGSSPAAGTFTTFTSTGIDDNATSTALTISSADNVGVGTATPDRLFEVDEASGDAYMRLRASDTGGGADTIFENLAADNGQNNYIYFGDLDDVNIGIIRYSHASDFMSFTVNASERMRVQENGIVRPGADNTQPIGAASFRWSVVYAGTGTINTSDEREKQQIADLDDAERRVAVAIKGLVKKYKYNDAVALKGGDARIHVGVIAQEVIAAFAAEGLDATRYALLCHDTWEAEPEETDDEGNVISPGIEAGERYGIRYDELLAFMIAAL